MNSAEETRDDDSRSGGSFLLAFLSFAMYIHSEMLAWVARFFFLFLLCPFWPGGAWAQVIPANNEVKSLPAAKPSASSSQATAPQEAFVIESFTTKANFENDGTQTYEVAESIHILSDAGVQRWGVLSFSYMKFNQTLDIDYVRVKKADGSVVPTPLEDAQEITSEISRLAPFYTDQREKHVAVKGLASGDVLEYSWHVRVIKALIPGQFWMQYEFGHDQVVMQETLELSIPSGRTIQIKNRGPKFQVLEQGGRRVYRWSYSNPQRKEESEDEAVLWKRTRGQQDQPDVMLSSFSSWDEVGHWYEQLQRERIQPTAEIQAKAAQLTKNASDDLAKLRAIYTFVSTKYRYIGIALGVGRFQPHFASEVMDNGYGDCKDKHTLLASLLIAAGFRVYPVLISSVRDVDPDVPSPGQFDHVISLVALGDAKIWLDTTPEVAPFTFLVGPLRGKRGLVIHGDSSSLETTPLNPDFKSFQTFDMKAKLDDSGTLTASAERTLSGSDFEVLLRGVFRNTAMPQWKDLAQRISYTSGFGGEVSDVNASPPEDIAQPFHISYKYTRKQYGDWDNHRISPPLPLMYLPDIPDNKKSPSAPLWLGVPEEIQFHSTIELPKSYTLEVPDKIDLKEDFAEYHAEYSLKDGVFTTARRLVVRVSEVPVEAYEKYKVFRKKIEDERDMLIPLSFVSAPKPGVAAAALPSSSAGPMNSLARDMWSLPSSSDSVAAQYENDARIAMMRGDVEGAVTSLQSAVSKDPKFVRAWPWLGSLLFARFQQDAGLDAYRSAIKADPTQAVSYKMLGFVLTASGKLDEAVSVWQELIKINAEDHDAEANLANALLALKRYPAAASAAESAVKRAPDKVSYQMLLGRAYLGSGNADRAQAAFEAAIKLDSSPMVLNNVAYEMAEQKLNLPVAKQYSETAVRQEEDATSKLELADLRSSDLTHTDRLAMFWDTLGWVDFRRDDLGQAEKYLRAAWELSQDPLVGRHLAQLYEKQRKMAAALHLYQLAYAATPVGLHGTNSRTALRDAGEDADLKRLGAKPDVMNAQSDLNKMRTFSLPKIVSQSASADYFVLLSSNGEVKAKFISGADSLKGAEEAIGRIHFRFSFPDGSPTRIARKALLACYPYSGCSIVLLTQRATATAPSLLAAAP